VIFSPDIHVPTVVRTVYIDSFLSFVQKGIFQI